MIIEKHIDSTKIRCLLLFQDKMDAPELSLNSSMFDFSLHLSPETTIQNQNVIHNTSNVEQGDHNQSIFLEIGIVESEIHNQQASPNEDENHQTSQYMVSTDGHGDDPSQSFQQPISGQADCEPGVQWFEEDVDLTKIFLCSNDGDLDVDEFNMGFSENILFASEEESQQLTKKGQESSTNLMSATCLELNNNCEYRESTISKEKITDGDRLLEQSNETNLLTTVEVKQKYDRSKPPSSYNCKHCSKTFRYSSRLKRHLTTHQKKQYPCRICHKLFSRVDVMEVHIARTHLKNGHTRTEVK